MPLNVRTDAPKTTAKILAPTIPPATNATALIGSTDCNAIAAKEPIVTIRTINGKPTTSKQTVNVKVQIKKLFIIKKKFSLPKLSVLASVIFIPPKALITIKENIFVNQVLSVYRRLSKNMINSLIKFTFITRSL
jgi:hypothetical protein